ncbi:MAG: Mg(2+) transporter, partial [Chaenotheca gracillima]
MITKDASTRFEEIAKVVRAVMIDHLVEPEASLDPAPVAALLPKLHAWTHSFATAARSVFEDNREAYYAQGEATPLLGMASKRLYKF